MKKHKAILTGEDIVFESNRYKNKRFINAKKVNKSINELETFLIVDFGQNDWSPRFLRRHFNILRDQLGFSKQPEKEMNKR